MAQSDLRQGIENANLASTIEEQERYKEKLLQILQKHLPYEPSV